MMVMAMPAMVPMITMVMPVMPVLPMVPMVPMMMTRSRFNGRGGTKHQSDTNKCGEN